MVILPSLPGYASPFIKECDLSLNTEVAGDTCIKEGLSAVDEVGVNIARDEVDSMEELEQPGGAVASVGGLPSDWGGL